MAAILALFPAIGNAQNCKALKPLGGGADDSAQINECLRTKGVAKLRPGTFLLHNPVVFPREKEFVNFDRVKLTGRGSGKTRLRVVQPDCKGHWPFVNEPPENTGRYQPVIQVVRSPKAELSKFELDLTELRQDCGFTGNYMVEISRSPEARVSRLRIAGSRYGTTPHTTGGANDGGILVVNSYGAQVTDNSIEDLGFMPDLVPPGQQGPFSSGHAGIAIQSSGDALVENNQIMRVAFGILVTNGSAQQGYHGDSSGTVISGNKIVGAANINCATCSQGRALKLQACSSGDEPPLQRLEVRHNTATEFGGASGIIGGSGLDLVCGVQYSTFENNVFIGASTAPYALQVRSSFGTINPTHHNRFNFNTFISGKPREGCDDDCTDVHFTPDGPDQIGIRRNGPDRAGTNSATTFSYDTNAGCAGYSRAFFQYLDGQESVRIGQSIELGAANIRPLAAIRFRFVNPNDGTEVASHSIGLARFDCAVSSEAFSITAPQFSPGVYQVFAEYKDGNSKAVIQKDLVGTIKIRPDQ